MRERLSAWLQRADRRTSIPLPEIPAPSLDGLDVEVDPPAPVTKPELLARYEALVRARSPRRARAGGEAVCLGDDAVLDVVGTDRGRVLPMSTHQNLAVAVLPQPPLPSFFLSLVGLRVGSRQRVAVLLPFDYPNPALRGEIATFDIAVRGASEVLLLDPDREDFIAALDRGPTLTDVMASLRADLEAERQQQTLLAAYDAALDLLCARAPVEIPAALVEAELWQRWAEAEGPLLLERGATEAELTQAWEGWSLDPRLRADVTRRLHIGLVLGAVAKRDRIAPSAANVGPYLAPVAAQLGLTVEAAREALRAEPKLAAAALAQIHHQLAYDHVARHVRVHLRDAAVTAQG